MEPEIVGKRIKDLMIENKKTIKEFAEEMGLSERELNEKIEGKEEFHLDEMKKIKEIFNLDIKSCDRLFFKEDEDIAI